MRTTGCQGCRSTTSSRHPAHDHLGSPGQVRQVRCFEVFRALRRLYVLCHLERCAGDSQKGHPDPTRPELTKHEHLSCHDGHRPAVNINALNVALCSREVIRGHAAPYEPPFSVSSVTSPSDFRVAGSRAVARSAG